MANNYFNAVKRVMGLFTKTNKANGTDNEQETEDFILPEFDSKLTEDEIITLTATWTSEYESYFKPISTMQKTNIEYWSGKQNNDYLGTNGGKKPLVDNLLFEALETFLPIATRANPQAVVKADGTPEGDKLSRTVQNALEYQSDKQHLRMKLKGVTRNWALYLIGGIKIGWNSTESDIETSVILSSRFIFDKNAHIDEAGFYHGEFLGEKKKCTARKLARMFPKEKSTITTMVQGNMGSKVNYTEWWTTTDLFFTLGRGTVLGKYKNPHWNYDGKAQIENSETGAMTEEEVQGRNHFASPQFPYLFLSIFNLGKQPHDETNLIQQNISLQDVVNRRYSQIDKNVDSQNNGIVLSGKYFTKEQASEAATQLARGNPLWVPEGDISASYQRDSAPSLPADVFTHLQDARNEIRNIFGTAGSTPQGTESQKTARGKILINQLDASRIGGGVTEYIEALASSIYNWYVQMMYVYYTDEHSFSIVGPKAQELMTITNTDFLTKLHVSVKDGSLIPKDPLTKRNEAMDLWSANAIAPIPFYTALDYPNPYESAKDLLTWQLIQKGALPPQVMFPDLGQAPQANSTPTIGGPAVNGQEANREINVAPEAPDITSKQLIGSIPLQ